MNSTEQPKYDYVYIARYIPLDFSEESTYYIYNINIKSLQSIKQSTLIVSLLTNSMINQVSGIGVREVVDITDPSYIEKYSASESNIDTDQAHISSILPAVDNLHPYGYIHQINPNDIIEFNGKRYEIYIDKQITFKGGKLQEIMDTYNCIPDEHRQWDVHYNIKYNKSYKNNIQIKMRQGRIIEQMEQGVMVVEVPAFLQVIDHNRYSIYSSIYKQIEIEPISLNPIYLYSKYLSYSLSSPDKNKKTQDKQQTSTNAKEKKKILQIIQRLKFSGDGVEIDNIQQIPKNNSKNRIQIYKLKAYLNSTRDKDIQLIGEVTVPFKIVQIINTSGQHLYLNGVLIQDRIDLVLNTSRIFLNTGYWKTSNSNKLGNQDQVQLRNQLVLINDADLIDALTPSQHKLCVKDRINLNGYTDTRRKALANTIEVDASQITTRYGGLESWCNYIVHRLLSTNPYSILNYTHQGPRTFDEILEGYGVHSILNTHDQKVPLPLQLLPIQERLKFQTLKALLQNHKSRGLYPYSNNQKQRVNTQNTISKTQNFAYKISQITEERDLPQIYRYHGIDLLKLAYNVMILNSYSLYLKGMYNTGQILCKETVTLGIKDMGQLVFKWDRRLSESLELKVARLNMLMHNYKKIKDNMYLSYKSQNKLDLVGSFVLVLVECVTLQILEQILKETQQPRKSYITQIKGQIIKGKDYTRYLEEFNRVQQKALHEDIDWIMEDLSPTSEYLNTQRNNVRNSESNRLYALIDARKGDTSSSHLKNHRKQQAGGEYSKKIVYPNTLQAYSKNTDNMISTLIETLVSADNNFMQSFDNKNIVIPMKITPAEIEVHKDILDILIDLLEIFQPESLGVEDIYELKLLNTVNLTPKLLSLLNRRFIILQKAYNKSSNLNNQELNQVFISQIPQITKYINDGVLSTSSQLTRAKSLGIKTQDIKLYNGSVIDGLREMNGLYIEIQDS